MERYQTLICSLAYSTCGSLANSQDLAQETFVTAWRRAADLREPGKLRQWLCGIVRNLAANALRRDLRRGDFLNRSMPQQTSHRQNAIPPRRQ